MRYDLPTTTLGRTGLEVTRLGIGGYYAESPDHYRQALDWGATYLDTARVYRDGEDEHVVSQAIAGRRDEIVLSSKTTSRDAEGARQDLATSLAALGTDYLDVWHIHYLNKPEELEQVMGPGGAMEAAVQARDEGLVRFIGVTGHVWDVVADAVATGRFDTVLCWYNCAMPEPEARLFPEAQKHDTGVVIMQATRVDKLLDAEDAPPLAGFYRYVLTHPAVSVVLRGLREPLDRFRQVAAALTEGTTLTPDERRAYEAYGARMLAAGKLEL
jgi:predicted aldo/keto reductase-like oxidoreductase